MLQFLISHLICTLLYIDELKYKLTIKHGKLKIQSVFRVPLEFALPGFYCIALKYNFIFKEFLIYAKNSKRNLVKTRVFLTMSLLKRKAPHPFVIACQLGFSEPK